MSISKVISGGQTGADLYALQIAKELGIQTGGWMPFGFKTEDGSKPEIAEEYGLKCLETTDYPSRTMKNVDDSDGTIAFCFHYSPGTYATIGYCQSGKWKKGDVKTLVHNKNQVLHKPVCIVNDSSTDSAALKIRQFILDNNISVLNVAGHRESSARVVNYEGYVKTVLRKALQSQ